VSLKTEKLRLRIYIGIFIVVLLLGTFGYMATEGLSLLDALYFTIVTIATVGYGDIVPATPLGKLLDVVLIVTGVGTFVGLVANLTEVFIKQREQELRLHKLQMLVGLYFSECGTALLRLGVAAESEAALLLSPLAVHVDWKSADYARARAVLTGHAHAIDPQRMDLPALQKLLEASRDLLPRLLESPYVLEHELFTDLLIAVLHLREELQHRESLAELPSSDLKHIAGDLQRIQKLQGRQWLAYLEHLQREYPFLFSLAVRTNPFTPGVSATIEE